MMVEIARREDDHTAVSLADVSRNTRISRRYLEQLVISLKNAALVRGIAGKKGGYVLTRAAENIKIGQIIEAAIGPVNIVDCVQHPQNCLESTFCECRWVYQTINDRIVKVLNELYLDDLVAHAHTDDQCQQLSATATSCPTRERQSIEHGKENE